MCIYGCAYQGGAGTLDLGFVPLALGGLGLAAAGGGAAGAAKKAASAKAAERAAAEAEAERAAAAEVRSRTYPARLCHAVPSPSPHPKGLLNAQGLPCAAF